MEEISMAEFPLEDSLTGKSPPDFLGAEKWELDSWAES
ncbi:hypothetical protein LINPERPRIM_LOCUS30561 [Linum perenne]